MKTISMSYKEYQDELLSHSAKGYRAGLRDVARAIAGNSDNIVHHALDGDSNAMRILEKLGIEWKPKDETKDKTEYTMDDIPF